VKQDPSVSIVMPNYNKGKFLEESINSIISQDYKNWNLFLIDNASTDNTKSILSNYNNPKYNIRLVYLTKNKGVAFSRNLGIRLSKSKYIAFIDSDDYWDSNKLKNQINFMEKFNYNFTYTDYTPFFLKNNIKDFKKIVSPRKTFNFNEFINDTSIATSSMIIRKSIIDTTKFPKIKTLEDYCFKCALFKKGYEATKLNQNSMYYRITKNSLSSNKLRSLYWSWHINKKYNKLSFFKCIKSALLISLSSLKRYGFK
jgi:teichuronic acid biosynthesis glycosyltransferase TuaG